MIEEMIGRHRRESQIEFCRRMQKKLRAMRAFGMTARFNPGIDLPRIARVAQLQTDQAIEAVRIAEQRGDRAGRLVAGARAERLLRALDTLTS